jgi:hypothetical protein
MRTYTWDVHNACDHPQVVISNRQLLQVHTMSEYEYDSSDEDGSDSDGVGFFSFLGNQKGTQEKYMLGYDVVADENELAEREQFCESMEVAREEVEAEMWNPKVHPDRGAWVFVFPRAEDNRHAPSSQRDFEDDEDDELGKGILKTLDTDGEPIRLEDPVKEMRKIFPTQHSAEFVSTKDKGFPEFFDRYGQPMKEIDLMVYQNVIRKKFLSIMATNGIQLSHKQSIDHDEVIVKAWLDRAESHDEAGNSVDGPVIKAFAETYNWSMPFSEDAQTQAPTNASGETVFAYTTYTAGNAAQLQPFKRSDEIKLMWVFLTEWLNLDELKKQKVITNFFVAFHARESAGMDDEWGDPRQVCCVPGEGEHLNWIREEFGDLLGFFFQWLQNFLRHFRILAGLGLIAFILRRIFEQNHYIFAGRVVQYIFGACLFIVAPWMMGSLKALRARKCQLWDSDGHGHELISPPNPKHAKHSHHRRTISWIVSTGTTVAYTFFSMVCVVKFRYWMAMPANRAAYETLYDRASMVTVSMIIAFNFVWSNYAVSLLTDIENHRFERNRIMSLGVKLALVKITFAIFPLFWLGFMQNKFVFNCADSPAALTDKLYANVSTWESVDLTENGMLHHVLTWKNMRSDRDGWVPGEPFCIGGCYPVPHCASLEQQGWRMLMGKDVPTCTGDTDVTLTTNCVRDVEDYLRTYFITYVLIDLFFLVIPRLQSWMTQRQEMAIYLESFTKLPFGIIMPHLSVLLSDEAHQLSSKYTYIELQAKNPPYEYNSWGGGPVDDFLEFAIMFSVCLGFGICLPLVFPVAFAAFLVMYRLIAFRMVYVTQRPLPVGAKDIGVWSGIFNTIVVVSVFTNCGMACYVMYPARMLDDKFQTLLFSIAEHFILLILVTAYFSRPATPIDVEEASRANQEFLGMHEQKHLDKDRGAYMKKGYEWYKYDHIDIGLK